MSEPLKGGFATFTNSTPFNTGQNMSAPSTGLFGNTSGAAPAGTSAFGGGTGGSLFGNITSKPGGLFGNNAGSNAPAPAGGTLFGNLNTGSSLFGANNNNTSGGMTGGNAASSSGPGLFGTKPAEQTTASTTTAPATGATPQPTGGFFTLGNNNQNTTAQTQTSSAPALPSLFGAPKPADSSSTSTTAAPTVSLFGGSTTAVPSSTTSTAPPLFGNVGTKKDDENAKDKPSTGLFGPSSASKDAPSAPAAGVGLFGSKPATDAKDTASTTKDGEKKDASSSSSTVPLFGSVTSTAAKDTSATSSSALTSISVPPPSMLRGKTIEEIVNKWSSELETNVKDFTRLAGEIAVWDRALIDNGNTIAALFQHVMLAEREQNDLEQSLKHVEEQQMELASTLDVYEKYANELFDSQGGGLRALDVGPADAERDKQYSLASDLNTHLDDLSRSLMQMIDSVNTISDQSNDGVNGVSKDDSPLEQIAQILSSHLESLQWIDGAVREVDGKVTDVERRIREASSNGANPTSVTGFNNSHSSRPRGFR